MELTIAQHYTHITTNNTTAKCLILSNMFRILVYMLNLNLRSCGYANCVEYLDQNDRTFDSLRLILAFLLYIKQNLGSKYSLVSFVNIMLCGLCVCVCGLRFRVEECSCVPQEASPSHAAKKIHDLSVTPPTNRPERLAFMFFAYLWHICTICTMNEDFVW